mgnify:CR=1 FL=1
MMTTAESDFNRYQDDALIHRCSDYARWTLPSVFPEFLHVGTGNQIVQYDYQSMGAMLVNRYVAFPFTGSTSTSSYASTSASTHLCSFISI